MFINVVPITEAQHRQVRIRPLTHYEFTRKLNLATVMVNELPQAAMLYPVTFIKVGEGAEERYRLVAIFGLEAEQNLFLNAAGEWQAHYIPAILRRYPFALGQADATGENYAICLDMASDLVNESEGEPLFAVAGGETPLMANVKKFLSELQQMEQLTQQFCQQLNELGLIRPLTLQLKQGDKSRNITGLFAVNEDALNNLADESFLKLRQQRALGLIYAHLASIANFNKLIRMV